MFQQGMGPPVVAGKLRVSRKSAYAWHAAWRDGGAQALRSKGPSGRASRMRPAWRAWLDAALQEGPAAHGWVEDQRWTLARIRTVIARRFHVHFSLKQVSRILHTMGWSVQVPVHQAAEQDPKAVQRWVKEVWPQVGKPSRATGAWLCFEDESGQSLKAAQGTYLVPRRPHPGGPRHRQGVRPGLSGSAGVYPAQRAHPPDLPTPAPHRPHGREKGLW